MSPTRARRHVRRMTLLLTSFSSFVAIALAVTVSAAFALRYFDQGRILRLAVGPPESSDTRFAEAVQRLLPHSVGSIRLQVVKTESASASAAVLEEGRADLAIIRNDVAVPRSAGILLIVHKDTALLIARPGSKISKVSDLQNKRVGVVPGTQANLDLFETILTRSGVRPGAVNRIALQGGQTRDAINADLVDAMLAVAPLGDTLHDEITSALAKNRKAGPVFIDLKNAEAIAQRQPAFEKVDIPSGFFRGSPSWPSEDVSSLSVFHSLVARQNLSEAIIADLTKRLFAMRTALAAEAPIAQFMEAPKTEKGARYPLHRGAAAYYGDTEKTFMDRYGDWIYILAMVLGAGGSAVASVISSMQVRARRAAMAVIADLVKIEREARSALDVKALREHEQIVREAALQVLGRARDNRFDEAGLETVRLAIDEARRTIEERRRDLEAREAPSCPVRVVSPGRSDPT